MTHALYDPTVLDHGRHPRHASLPPDATAMARGTNPLCGDQVDVAVTITADVVSAVGFEAKGCVVCVAAASVMSEAAHGLSLGDLAALRGRFERRVRDAGEPSPLAPALEAVAAAARLPGRQDCALLAWQTLARALDASPPAAASLSATSATSPHAPLPGALQSESHKSGDALEVAARWMADGHAVALATLVSAAAVGPCPPGSAMVVRATGEFFGSVSGGCVEGAVLKEALGVLGDGAPRLLDFSVTGERAWGFGLPCGGSVEVLVSRVERAWLDVLLARRRARRPTALVTRLGDASRVVVGDDPTVPALAPSVQRAAEAVRDGAPSRRHDEGGERWFIQGFHTPRKLVLVGGVHIAQALAGVAKSLAMDVVVVDPREGFVGRGRFTDVEVRAEWPDTALPSLLDARSALVVLTHDAKLDDPALAAALRSEAFYIGALGSRKTQAERRARLLALGFTERDLARIHGPVGLAIGAVGAGEIALSIAAEIVKEMRLAPAKRAPRVGAVVLAAGMSRRMGGPNKLLADVGGEPMVRAVARAAVESGVAPVAVVTGHDAHAVEGALAGLPVEFVANPRYREGMGTSVAAGASALAGRVDALVVVLGDMALVRAEHIRRLVERYDPSTSQHILVAEHRGRRGNPVLWPARYLPELAELGGDTGGRALFERHASAVVRVPFDDDAVLFDVDAMGDLEGLGARRRARP
jgi:xanthine dehydrogenase accessory factor